MNTKKQFMLHDSCFMIHEKGFTLIELMVVVAVISLVSVISISNFRRGEKQRSVSIAQDMIINSVRNAQNFTLTGKNTNNPNFACRAPQYYFVTFTYSSTHTLSARNNCGTDDLIETYTMPTNTRIKASGLLFDGLAAATNLAVYYYPPFATIKGRRDGGAAAAFATEKITVESSDGLISKTITIDGIAGRIGE